MTDDYLGPEPTQTAKLDDLIRKAETGEDWAEICRLEAEAIHGPIKVVQSFFPNEWLATRPDWDLGMAVGGGNSPAEAVEDLLEKEAGEAPDRQPVSAIEYYVPPDDEPEPRP